MSLILLVRPHVFIASGFLARIRRIFVTLQSLLVTTHKP
jgi:hypothetical protein